MPLKDIQPAGWKAPKGYANGMLGEGRVLCVGGQIGWNAGQRFEAHDFIGQMQQTLRNIVDVVEAAGGRIEDIARLTWFVTDKAEYVASQSAVGAAYREVMGYHFPARQWLWSAHWLRTKHVSKLRQRPFCQWNGTADSAARQRLQGDLYDVCICTF